MANDTFYKDLGSRLPGVNSVLEEYFGVRASAHGNHLSISNSTLQAMLARDTITSGPQIALSEGSTSELAQRLVRSIPDDFKDRYPAPPKKIVLSKVYGLISEVEEGLIKTTIASEEELPATVENILLPVMTAKLGAKFVTAVSVNAGIQQAWVSLAKVLLLVQRYSEKEALKRMRAGALDSVLPTSLDALAYVDALTRFTPLHLTLPVYREGCAWHFQREAMWMFPIAPEFGLNQQFMFNLSPLSEKVSFRGLSGLRGMSAQVIWRYLRFVTTGVNRLCKFLNDPRSFAGSDGSIDLLRQAQAYSAIRLLFSDISAVNYAPNPHHRIGFAMSALDKLANLRIALVGDVTYNESRAMTDLASESQAENLRSILARRLKAMNYGDLDASLGPMVEQCYADFHEDLSKSVGGASTEGARLAYVRMLRNVRHGTFLNRGQFEDVFLSSAGNVPESLVTIPFALALGLLAEPAEFLLYRPQVP